MTVVDNEYATIPVTPPLVSPQDVESLTNGTVLADDVRTPLLISGASTAIRRIAGWHIAPILSETLVAPLPYGAGQLDVLLPTLKLRKVLEARVDGRVISNVGWLPSGQVWAGVVSAMSRQLEVDVHHGYLPAEVPDLAAVVAQVVAIAQSSPSGATREQAGALSVSWATTAPGVSGGLSLLGRDLAVIEAYRLGSLP